MLLDYQAFQFLFQSFLRPNGFPVLESLSFSFSLSDIWFFCWGVCNFLSSVLSKQKFEAMDGPVLQLRVTA